jgi:plastocyanin
VQVTPSANATTICGNITLTATPFDANNNALTRTVSWNTPGAALALSGSTGATVTATGVGVGTANITAVADGVQSNSVAIAVTGGQAPTTQSVAATAGSVFAPACVDVAAGGTVTWTFAAEHNVIFAVDPPGGDITPPVSSGSVSRTFPTAGSYTYTCTLHAGMNGRVVVR